MLKNRVPKKKEKILKEPKRKIPLRGIVLIIGILFLVLACKESPPSSSLPQKVKVPTIAKKVSETKPPDKKEGEKKEDIEYFYNPTGKPDPFKPFIQLSPSVKEYSKKVPQTPLQKYDISQLTLVAIILTPEGNIAMVEDSTGRGYFLKKGTEIGKNNGKVKQIFKDKVIIEEVYEDAYNQKKVNEISLFIHRVEEGGES